MLSFFKNILGFSSKESIRILMYHQVLPEKISFKNDMIVTSENLEEQLKYIKNKYQTVFFKELQKNASLKNKIILTFDDGYYNNLQYLLPLLEKYALKATIFIPTKLIEERQNDAVRSLMSFEEIRLLNPKLIEIALHSHSHQNYSQLSLQESEQDLIQNIKVLQDRQINFTKVFAYPYGRFPKAKKDKKEFFKMLEKIGIEAALRIGNKVESYPWNNKFEIKRIDIKYGDSLSVFKLKLKLGKIKF